MKRKFKRDSAMFVNSVTNILIIAALFVWHPLAQGIESSAFAPDIFYYRIYTTFYSDIKQIIQIFQF